VNLAEILTGGSIKLKICTIGYSVLKGGKDLKIGSIMSYINR
jgi:hypothetical protein